MGGKMNTKSHDFCPDENPVNKITNRERDNKGNFPKSIT